MLLSSAMLLAGLTFYPALASTLDDLYKQKEELQQEQQKYQSAAGNKEKEAKTIAAQIAQIESDIKKTEAEIQNTSSQITDVTARLDQLNKDIEVKNAELVVLKQKLNSAIVEIYRSSSRSDWELLFGFNSLSDAVNQTKYVESVESQAKSYHDQTQKVKSELDAQKSEAEKKKAELDSLKSQQEAYKRSSESQVAYKDRLLGLTKDQEQDYLDKADAARKEAASVENQIRRILSSRSRRADGTFGDGPGVGSRVSRGEYVGTQGSTGASSGDHVHFEVDLTAPARGWTSPWPYINSGMLSWPLRNFVITQDYGCTEFADCGNPRGPYGGGPHMGIDIAGPIGSPVLAPADGLVVLNEYFGGYGNAWAMKVDNGPYVLLGHLR